MKEPDGSYTTHQVSCNILCNWSKKREKHDLECISKKEKRAVRAVENEEKIGPSAFGWKPLYLKNGDGVPALPARCTNPFPEVRMDSPLRKSKDFIISMYVLKIALGS